MLLNWIRVYEGLNDQRDVTWGQPYFMWYLWHPERHEECVLFIYLFLNICLFIWLCQILVVAHGIFSCGMWDLIPWPGIEPGSHALRAQSLSHWISREVPGRECLVRLMKPKSKLRKESQAPDLQDHWILICLLLMEAFCVILKIFSWTLRWSPLC